LNTFQLQCFVTLSNTATFSEAAERLYISQSSFSNNIQSIEQELGVNLIVRGKGMLTFTEAGTVFLSYAKRIVDEFEKVPLLLRDYKSSLENRVLIYADPLSSYAYNTLLVEFNKEHPEIQTDIIEIGDETLYNMMESNNNIIGIVFSPTKKAHLGTMCLTLVSDRLAALVVKSHRLALSRRIKVSEIRNDEIQIISDRQSRFLNDFTLAQFRKEGFIPNVAPLDLWYNTAKETIRELGISAVFPEQVAKIFLRPGLRVVGLDVEKFYINVVMSENCKNAAAMCFYNYASEFLKRK